VTTGTNGNFTARVPAGRQYIFPRRVIDDYAAPRPQQLTAVEGQPLRVRFAYTPTPSFPIAGHVHRSDGTPAAGATVMAFGDDRFANTMADADGHFQFPSVPDNAGIFARLGDALSIQRTIDADSRGDLNVMLTAGRHDQLLPVQITDTAGRPIPNATVILVAGVESDSDGTKVRGNEKGKYTFASLRSDQTYRLIVSADGYNKVQSSAWPQSPRGEIQSIQIKLEKTTGPTSPKPAVQ
jgi:hypothetical protein